MGRRYELSTQEVSIGRADSCTICVNTDQVSRRHATVQHVLGKYYIVDMRSTNGTFVNEQKVERAKLVDGDQIRVGKTVIKYTESHVEQRYFEHAFNLASMDALTGAFNKRYFDETFGKEVQRSQQTRSPLSISMFKALGAAPASLQFSEVYSALQTKVVDAQENPLPIIQVAKLYEVQKSCAVSNHIWDGFWFIANGRAWRGLPPDIQKIVASAINDAGVAQRGDIKSLNETVQADLQSKGLAFNKTNPDSFRAKLRDGGFYKEWQERFGAEAWGLLEGAVGKLA